jgi:putative membrane-bound dehydrogenase-like protein
MLYFLGDLRILAIYFAVLAMILGPLATTEARSDDGKDALNGQFSEAPWSIEIVLTDEEFAALEPAPGPGFGGPVPGSNPNATPAVGGVRANRETVANVLGVQFPWIVGEMVLWTGAGSEENSNKVQPTKRTSCRLRYDGDFTYLFSATGPKRPLYLETLEPLADLPGVQQPLGRAFRFHNLQFDPTLVRERVSLHVAGMLGVPAPRIAHVELSLRVGGAEPRYLGLYTMLEVIDESLLTQQGLAAESLRLQTNGLGSLQYLGDQWSAYEPLFRASRELTADEKKRVIEFAKLIGESSDAEFSERLGDFIQPDGLIRYFALQVLVGNVTGFSTIGTNDYLCLDPTTGRFTLFATELETALGGAALAGTAEQLANLSLSKPFTGSLPLFEKLIGVPEWKRQYEDVLRMALEKGFGDSSMSEAIQKMLAVTAEERKRDADAAAERLRQVAGGGFGPPSAGPPGAGLPPDVLVFLKQRRASIERQLQGEVGFSPSPPNFGGMGRREGAETAISSEVFAESVTTPAGFQATLFGKSPDLNYPVAIAAEPTGAIYVGIDEQGSLGTTPGGGRVVRCVDRNQDGKMDEFTVFCRVDHVRGVAYRGGKVWVSHPPYLSVFEDTNGDGVSDRQTQLVSGLTTNMVNDRGGDHTTNFVRIGIDGWLYIGDGDYGIPGAVGIDGSTVTLRGGGILRVRPDGTELELFSSGLRNPFDMAIDPYLNMFTRDNTNDGGGWDTRVSQLFDSAEYGYPRLFANFSDEIMPTLGTYGGGGGTGGLYIEDPRWPAPWNHSLFTGDWGRSAVFHHPLQSQGATFEITQEPFVTIPRATGMDLDALGNLYIASWWSGEASVYVGPHVGFVARVTPVPEPIPSGKNLLDADTTVQLFSKIRELSLTELIKLLREPQAMIRFHVQGELLRRGPSVESTEALETVVADRTWPLSGRVAALFALKQLDGERAHPKLIQALDDETIREFAIRALGDRRSQLAGVTTELLLPYLNDPNPRVVTQAVIALGRLGDPAAANWLLPLAERSMVERPDPAVPDAQAVIPHLAVQAMVRLQAIDACLAGLDGDDWRSALRALRQMHHSTAVTGLIERLERERDLERQTAMLTTLIRLYQHETPYDGSWWGIRPDTTGPFYDPMTWSESERIQTVVRAAIDFAAPPLRAALLAELQRHQIQWEGLSDATELGDVAAFEPIVIQSVDPNNPEQIGNLGYAESVRRTLELTGDAVRGQELFRARSCMSCHTAGAGQRPVGPHLADIGKRYKADELLESLLKPSEKIAQGYETQLFLLANGEVVTGFVMSETGRQLVVRDSQGKTYKIAREDIEERSRQTISAMPEGLLGSLQATELADLLAYLQSL